MKYVAAVAVLTFAGWALVRLVAMREARRGLDQLARQREAGTR